MCRVIRMEYENFTTRYNVMDIFSLEAFTNIKGGVNRECKDVYFMRAVGAGKSLSEDVRKMDRTLTERMFAGQCRYNRVNEFPGAVPIELIQTYTDFYNNWIDSGRTKAVLRKTDEAGEFPQILGKAFAHVVNMLKNESGNISESIEKNFAVKLMFWFDETAAVLTTHWNPKLSMKFVVHNVRKSKKYLFCYLLTQLGIDVLMLQSKLDIEETLKQLQLSKTIVLGSFTECEIAKYRAEEYRSEKPAPVRSEKTAEKQERIQPKPVIIQPVHRVQPKSGNDNVKDELEFEELALMAASVVMIAIHDESGKAIGTGSGIMIGKGGYILTNNHVASGGRFYSVRIEDDEAVYQTDEVIKYNPVLDLAIIRIDRQLKPLAVYHGQKKLVRGQKVVAIGSPLGLFNSVSDGIISGFRKIDDVDMIQFTAPISHGSSGGAVLNMYGEVIGISTAGIDNGQNINLAVGYEFINDFIRGFV